MANSQAGGKKGKLRAGKPTLTGLLERLWSQVHDSLCCARLDCVFLCVRSSDAHQALTLLEEYSTQLGGDKKALQSAINRLIRVFRSRLFQALLGEYTIYDTSEEKILICAHYQPWAYAPMANSLPSARRMVRIELCRCAYRMR